MAAIPPQSFLAPPPTPGVPQGPIPTLKLSKSSLASKGRKKKTTVQIYDSNSSLAAKRAQLRTARPANLALVTKASIEELGRLTKVIDEQKALLFRYEDEIRTLKIVNMRQDKAIKKMDRDNGAVPKLIHSLNEELRIVKVR